MVLYISNIDTLKDGFGQKYRDIILLYCFCKYSKNIFMYSPYKKTDHNEYNDKNYEKSLDEFIRFNKNKYIKTNKNKHLITKSTTFRKYIHDLSNEYIKPAIDINLIIKPDFINELIDIYNTNPKPIIKFREKKTIIAVHIRYGDISLPYLMKKYSINKKNIKTVRTLESLFNFFHYYISFEKYIDSMKELEKIYPNAYFYIYSQAVILEQYKDFNIFKKLFKGKIELKINIKMIDTFESIRKSDIILMGFSGFSWCASILSNAKVYYIDKKNRYNSDNNWFLNSWTKLETAKTSLELINEFNTKVITNF